MGTVLLLFLIALICSLALTPLCREAGMRWGAVDRPAPRKVHSTPTPRSGGPAIFLAYCLTIFAFMVLDGGAFQNPAMFDNLQALLAGAVITFGVGLFDDFRRLPAWIKLVFQMIGATVAFAGGIRIDTLFYQELYFAHGALSYILTVFWFVLFVNAINLIDGLDGLAGGITLFTCLVMTGLLASGSDYANAAMFAAMSGAVLGFLRYNYTPASVFMGDGGSYFLGYMIAGLSIMGSTKSQVGAAFLIPFTAMGVPIFDALLSPLRRLASGREMFHPDKGHIHHRLMARGFSSKSVVTIIHAASFLLCAAGIVIVHFRNPASGVTLACVCIAAVVFVRKLGFLRRPTRDDLFRRFRNGRTDADLDHDRPALSCGRVANPKNVD